MSLDTNSEEWRRQCECRYILALRSINRQSAIDLLDKIEKARGKEARSRLDADCAKQWAAGNRGKLKEWYEPKQ